MLEDHRIGPELKMQDFDKYLNLINGEVIIIFHQFKACNSLLSYDLVEINIY